VTVPCTIQSFTTWSQHLLDTFDVFDVAAGLADAPGAPTRIASATTVGTRTAASPVLRCARVICILVSRAPIADVPNVPASPPGSLSIAGVLAVWRV